LGRSRSPSSRRRGDRLRVRLSMVADGKKREICRCPTDQPRCQRRISQSLHVTGELQLLSSLKGTSVPLGPR
jgi:hypothetical protein